MISNDAQQTPRKIFFADLTHTGVVVDAMYFPLSCGLIGGYALQELGPQEISVEIFKYPDDFAAALKKRTPLIMAFTNYSWSSNLAYAYAERIKTAHPDVITIFGGPNYPVNRQEQAEFIRERPAVDFFVDGEGELPFVALYRALASVEFSISALKAARTEVPSVHYVAEDDIVLAPLMPRITDLSQIPSPYLMGLMDKFFDDTLNPMIQTSRGCPYRCTYCHDGIEYTTKLVRMSQQRIEEEILYICERRKLPTLTLADLNFGIFKQDIETAQLLAKLRKKCGWPSWVDSAVAKQAKQRLMEISDILEGALLIGASVQSTDKDVLENIKRRNVPLDQMVDLAKAAGTGASSFSEVILNLPGDTREKHIHSVLDMLDIGMDEVRMYQFIMLPGTEGSDKATRELYKYKTLFRVLPRCFGTYELYNQSFNVFEWHEVSVASSTMSYEDYKYCRDFDLVIEIFNNGSVLSELLLFLDHYGIKRSAFFSEVLKRFYEIPELEEVFHQFRADEERNFYPSADAVRAFVAKPEAIEAYRSGVLGSNQIFWYRTTVFSQYFHLVVSLGITVGSDLLASNGQMSKQTLAYLEELKHYLLGRKGNLLSTDDVQSRIFHFDFVRMHAEGFTLLPEEVEKAEGMQISFAYPDEHRSYVDNFFNQFGRSTRGLAYALQRIGSIRYLYRSPVATVESSARNDK